MEGAVPRGMAVREVNCRTLPWLMAFQARDLTPQLATNPPCHTTTSARTKSRMQNFLRRLAFAIVALATFAAPVGAQTKPQVWTTNVVSGEFPSRDAALAAVRAQGGIYALAER